MPRPFEWQIFRGQAYSWVMPLYTPIGGSWLNVAESVQRIIVRRALSGQHPKTTQEVIDWLEQTVDGWNQDPPLCVERQTLTLSRAGQTPPFGRSGVAVANGHSFAS